MRSATAAPVNDIPAAVVSRLRVRRAELLQAIFARVRDGASDRDRAGDGDAEYLAGLQSAVAAALEYVLDGLERGLDGAGPIPSAACEQARRAARSGVSLDTVLRRYVLGHALLGEFVLEELDRDGLPADRKVLRCISRMQAALLDRLLIAITDEYHDELARAIRSPEQRRADRVRALLDGDTPGEPELPDYELGGWHLALIAVGVGAPRALAALAARADRRLLRIEHSEHSLWAWLGGRDSFATGEIDRILATAPVGEAAVIAVGEPGRDIAGWRLTHRQAQAALRVVLRHSEPSGVTRYSHVALLAFALADEPLAASLLEIYLAPLTQQRDGGELLRETLREYFRAGRNASSAAAALGVVRTTVENRLRAVEQILDRPLPTCFAELEVALRLADLDRN